MLFLKKGKVLFDREVQERLDKVMGSHWSYFLPFLPHENVKSICQKGGNIGAIVPERGF